MPAEVVAQSGPGAAKPVAATPAAPVAAATAPQPGAAVVAPPAPQLGPDELLKRERIAYERYKQKAAADTRAWETDKAELSTRASVAEQLEKREVLAKRNPVEFLSSIYGKDWYDVVVEAKVNGVPPAALIAGELDKLKADFDSKLSERDAAAKAQAEAAAKSSVEAERRALSMDARDWYGANADAYPLFRRLGDANSIGATLAQRIEAEFHRSTKRDASGAVVQNGRVLTAQQAADLLEADMISLAEEAASHAKYADKLRAKLQPQKPPGTVSAVKPAAAQTAPAAAQQRRTLSNEMTGSTPSDKPAMTAQERRAKAVAAWNSVRGAKST